MASRKPAASVVASEKGGALSKRLCKAVQGEGRQATSPWAAHLMERDHRKCTVVGKFTMLSTKMTVEEIRRETYDLIQVGYNYDDDDEVKDYIDDVDGTVLSNLLSRTMPTVIRLHPEDGGDLVFVNQFDGLLNDHWICTWYYGKQRNYRGITLFGDNRPWLISNNPMALFQNQCQTLIRSRIGTLQAEKIMVIQDSNGMPKQITYDQRIGRMTDFWDNSNLLPEMTQLHHFVIERLSDYLQERQSNGYVDRYAYITGCPFWHLRSMRNCYANEDSY